MLLLCAVLSLDKSAGCEAEKKEDAAKGRGHRERCSAKLLAPACKEYE